MRFFANMSLYFDSKTEAKNVFGVLNPEVKSDSRVHTHLATEGPTVHLQLEASDRAAMRAAVNSYGRWIALIEDIGGLH